MKILLIGEERRANEMRERLAHLEAAEIDLTDGGPEEVYEEYDLIFDLNFDDDQENLSYYASLRDKPVFVSSVKMSMTEAIYLSNDKIRCRLFGMNAMPSFIGRARWELSLFRGFEADALKEIMGSLSVDYDLVEDRVGMVTPRIVCMIINEACYTVQEGTASMQDIDLGMKLGTNYPFGPFEWADKIGVHEVFETLAALYEDTKEERYRICPMLKNRYLKEQNFYKS